MSYSVYSGMNLDPEDVKILVKPGYVSALYPTYRTPGQYRGVTYCWGVGAQVTSGFLGHNGPDGEYGFMGATHQFVHEGLLRSYQYQNYTRKVASILSDPTPYQVLPEMVLKGEEALNRLRMKIISPLVEAALPTIKSRVYMNSHTAHQRAMKVILGRMDRGYGE